MLLCHRRVVQFFVSNLITKSRNCTHPKLVIEKLVLCTHFSITSKTRTIATTVIFKLVLRTAFKITDPLRPRKSFQYNYYTKKKNHDGPILELTNFISIS